MRVLEELEEHTAGKRLETARRCLGQCYDMVTYDEGPLAMFHAGPAA